MIALLISRYALKHVLAIIAASRVTEVFTAFALLLVLGMAWLMESIGLSLAMGAFLAGMFLANSEYRHQIEADIMPFRGLLLGLFFMSIGMSIDLTLLLDSPYFIITAALVIMLFKAVVIFGLARFFSLNVKDSLQTGAYLSQMGEFGFVLFAFAAREGVIAYQHLGMLLLIITFSMILTPLIVPAILGWATRLQNGDLHTLEAEKFSHSTTDHETYDFIIAGFGRVGQTVAMRLSSAGYSYIAFDIDLGKVKFGRDLGFNVHFGNASRIDVLKSAHAEKARGLILTLDDRKAVLKTIIQIHELYPHLPLHARAHDIHEAQELQRFGVHASVPETIEASYQLGLSAITYNEDEDAERVQTFKDQIGLSRDTGYQDILDHYGPVKR